MRNFVLSSVGFEISGSIGSPFSRIFCNLLSFNNFSSIKMVRSGNVRKNDKSRAAQTSGDPESTSSTGITIKLGPNAHTRRRPGIHRSNTILSPEEEETISMYEAAKGTVCTIKTQKEVVQSSLQYIPGTFLAAYVPVSQTVDAGEGSGFVYDNKHVMTNYHVVKEASKCFLFFKQFDEPLEARVIYAEPECDLAILAVENSTFGINRRSKIGTSDDLQVGNRVYVLGNSGGMGGTFTAGIVSALNRSMPACETTGKMMHGVIQHDATQHSGNSGGPLLNRHGEVVGITTWGLRGKPGLNFAIPIDTARRIAEQLITTGRVERVSLGLMVQESGHGRELFTMVTGFDSPTHPCATSAHSRIQPLAIEIQPLTGAPRYVVDIIRAVDNVAVRTINDIRAIVEDKRAGCAFCLTLENSSTCVRRNISLSTVSRNHMFAPWVV